MLAFFRWRASLLYDINTLRSQQRKWFSHWVIWAGSHKSAKALCSSKTKKMVNEAKLAKLKRLLSRWRSKVHATVKIKSAICIFFAATRRAVLVRSFQAWRRDNKALNVAENNAHFVATILKSKLKQRSNICLQSAFALWANGTLKSQRKQAEAFLVSSLQGMVCSRIHCWLKQLFYTQPLNFFFVRWKRIASNTTRRYRAAEGAIANRVAARCNERRQRHFFGLWKSNKKVERSLLFCKQGQGVVLDSLTAGHHWVSALHAEVAGNREPETCVALLCEALLEALPSYLADVYICKDEATLWGLVSSFTDSDGHLLTPVHDGYKWLKRTLVLTQQSFVIGQGVPGRCAEQGKLIVYRKGFDALASKRKPSKAPASTTALADVAEESLPAGLVQASPLPPSPPSKPPKPSSVTTATAKDAANAADGTNRASSPAAPPQWKKTKDAAARTPSPKRAGNPPPPASYLSPPASAIKAAQAVMTSPMAIFTKSTMGSASKGKESTEEQDALLHADDDALPVLTCAMPLIYNGIIVGVVQLTSTLHKSSGTGLFYGADSSASASSSSSSSNDESKKGRNKATVAQEEATAGTARMLLALSARLGLTLKQSAAIGPVLFAAAEVFGKYFCEQGFGNGGGVRSPSKREMLSKLERTQAVVQRLQDEFVSKEEEFVYRLNEAAESISFFEVSQEQAAVAFTERISLLERSRDKYREKLASSEEERNEVQMELERVQRQNAELERAMLNARNALIYAQRVEQESKHSAAELEQIHSQIRHVAEASLAND